MFEKCGVFFPVAHGCLRGVGYFFVRSRMFERCGYCFLRSWMFERRGV